MAELGATLTKLAGTAGPGFRRSALRLFFGAILLSAPFVATPVLALSEIQQGDVPPPNPDEQIEKEPLPPVESVPLPDPVAPPANGDQTEPPAPDKGTVEPEGTIEDGTDGNEQAQPDRPDVDPNAPIPEIQYDLGALPEPVRRMHGLILEAAKTGDLEHLRPLIGTGDDQTQFALGGMDGDPIAFLKELSGDEAGHEILAILEEVLDAGYVHLGAGTPEDLYVWPYFFAVPLDKLTPPQRVELFKIVTAGDYEDMKSYGAYIFYRVGITPDGRWQFFVAGD